MPGIGPCVGTRTRHNVARAGSSWLKYLILPLLVAAAATACTRDSEPPTAVRGPDAGAPQFITTPTIQPVPETPVANGTRIRLGKTLFHDSRLSGNGSLSCASCHDIRQGGDNGQRFAIAANGKQTLTNVPTVLNSILNYTQFWDGRVLTVKEAVKSSLADPYSMGAKLGRVQSRLLSDPQMKSRFDQAYADGLTADNLIDAITAYVVALKTPNAPFDRYLKGDPTAVNQTVQDGFDLFMTLGCGACHQGRNIGGNVFAYMGVVTKYFDGRDDLTVGDNGLFNVTGDEKDRYKFRVPSLRNVARTAPYFHDGSAATLEDAVEIMLRYEVGVPVKPEQVSEIVAFLESLSADTDPSLQ